MSRTNIIIQDLEVGFICMHCGESIGPSDSGTKNRNHCPHCLYSRHVDLRPGDRRAACRGLMRPIGIWVRPDGEWSILHRCERCGFIRANRIASDDREDELLKLALRAVTTLPFPLETYKR